MLPAPCRAVVRIALVLSLAAAGAAGAEQGAPVAPAAEPFQILDNSFLVEEAFNQEAGVFQNIFGAIRSNGIWAASFVQEWPVASQRHQLSYTLSWAAGGGDAAFGDTLINYRYQALTEGPGRPAFSPRVSAILPSGEGNDAGLQFNLPFSKQTGDVYWHWNAGLTWLPSSGSGDDSTSLESPFLAGSTIYRVAPMFHAMLEVVANFDEVPLLDARTARYRSLTASPGARGGWNIGDHQLILGFAVPTTWTEDEDRETAAFFYVSYELPFRK